jgi:hypothetical protein
MNEKYRDNTGYDHENTKPHLIFDLVWLLKTGEHEKSCRICNRAKKTGLSFCRVFASNFDHFLFATPIAAPNRSTMANDSLLPSPGTMAMGSFEPPRYNKSSTVAEKKKAAPALLDNLLHSILLCNIPTKSEWQW